MQGKMKSSILSKEGNEFSSLKNGLSKPALAKKNRKAPSFKKEEELLGRDFDKIENLGESSRGMFRYRNGNCF